MKGSALAAFLIVAALEGTPSRGDELHLNKDIIEGRIVAETVHVITIETQFGELSVPSYLVTRRVNGPTRLDRYRQERDREPLTPARNLELAAWCRSIGLTDLARDHVAAALQAEPQNEAARRAAGYVRLGDVWLKAENAEPPATPNNATVALVDRIVDGWAPSIASIREQAFPEDSSARDASGGRAALRTIRSPLAVPAACRALGSGGVESRCALADFLGTFDDDIALINLVALSLIDPHSQVRDAANGELVRAADRRVVLLMRTALRCEVEAIVRRAAAALGRLGDASAVDDLIAALPADSSAEPPVSLRELFSHIEAMLPEPTLVPLAEPALEYAPRVALPGFGRTLVEMGKETGRPQTGFRSFVQDALIEITGENYGFDIAAWKDWAARHSPGARSAP